MSAEWYYEANGEQFGPVSASQLKHLANNGFLKPTHLVWKEGVAKKVPASTVKGLFSPVTAASKPAAAPKKPTTAPPKPAAVQPRQDEVVELEAVEEAVVDLPPVDELEPLAEVVPVPIPVMPIPVRVAGAAPARPSGLQPPPLSAAGAEPTPSAGAAGRFRVMHGGHPQGPYTLEEIRHLLAAGQLAQDDQLAIEVWVPLTSLGELLVPHGGSASAAGKRTFAKAGASVETEANRDEPQA